MADEEREPLDFDIELDDENLDEDVAKAFEAGFTEEPEQPDVHEPGERDPGHLGEETVDDFGDMTADEEAEALKAARAERGEVEEDPEPETPEPAAKKEPETPPEPAATENLDQRLAEIERRFDGKFGELNRNLQNLLKAGQTAADQARDAGHAAPSEKRIKDALASSAKMKELREEFPHFAESFEDVMLTVAQGLTAGAAAPAPDMTAVNQQAAEAAAQAAAAAIGEFQNQQIEEHHEGWLETINSERYAAWIDKQPEEIKKLEQSRRITDVVKLLDEHKKFETWVAKQPEPVRERYSTEAQLDLYAKAAVESEPDARRRQRETRSQSRLESAAPATTRSTRGSRGQPVTEQEAFEAGFKGTKI